ncbi:MAG: virulence factor [Ilumatobacteraceae bacterium]
MITIYWRDIPAQLTARVGGEQQKLLLHARFQHAIDRAAAVAGLTATNDYVQEWRSVAGPLEPGGVDAQLDRLCAEVEGAYPRPRLEAIVANGGLDPDAPSPDTPSDPPPDPPSSAEESQ